MGLGAVSAVDSTIDDVTSLNSTLLSCDAPADGDSLSLSDMENAVSANENDISDIKETSLSASDIDNLTISDGSDIVSANSTSSINSFQFKAASLIDFVKPEPIKNASVPSFAFAQTNS